MALLLIEKLIQCLTKTLHIFLIPWHNKKKKAG